MPRKTPDHGTGRCAHCGTKYKRKCWNSRFCSSLCKTREWWGRNKGRYQWDVAVKRYKKKPPKVSPQSQKAIDQLRAA